VRWLAVCGVALAGCGHAGAAGSVTIDFPITVRRETPPGLAALPMQVTAPDGMGYAEFMLLPAAKDQELFLTVIFKETGKAGPGIFWTDEVTDEQVTVTANLAEGVVGLNQRTIRLAPEISTRPGRLVISGDQKKLFRVRLDWIAPSAVFIAADQEDPDLISNGRIFSGQELTGGEPLALPDAWFGDVLDAPLQERVMSLDGNVEFVAPLNRAPQQSLLRARFLGLPLGVALKVWINGKLAGRMQPAVPLLSDAGYVRLASGRFAYAGWRPGAFVIEDGLLKEGDNSIVIETPKKGGFIRDAALQVRVPDAGAPPAPEFEDAAPESAEEVVNDPASPSVEPKPTP